MPPVSQGRATVRAGRAHLVRYVLEQPHELLCEPQTAVRRRHGDGRHVAVPLLPNALHLSEDWGGGWARAPRAARGRGRGPEHGRAGNQAQANCRCIAGRRGGGCMMQAGWQLPRCPTRHLLPRCARRDGARCPLTVPHGLPAWALGHLAVLWPSRQIIQVEVEVVLRAIEARATGGHQVPGKAEAKQRVHARVMACRPVASSPFR